jgi:hypothetical protein
MGHEQGVFSRRFVFGLPNDPFYFGSFLFLQDEFISKGENDMKRNKRPSRETAVRRGFGREKRICAHLRRVEDGRWRRKEGER